MKIKKKIQKKKILDNLISSIFGSPLLSGVLNLDFDIINKRENSHF